MKRWLIILLLASSPGAFSQKNDETPGVSTTWLILQTIPSLTWTSFPSQTNFAFEWEVAPVLYSFGLTKLVSPWKSFIVLPPARFTGSIELNASLQLYPGKVGTTHFGYSGQILGHLPLMERGEYLVLNLGIAHYSINQQSSTYVVAGLGTLFSFVNYNIKYSPADKIWMNAIEIRFF